MHESPVPGCQGVTEAGGHTEAATAGPVLPSMRASREMSPRTSAGGPPRALCASAPCTGRACEAASPGGKKNSGVPSSSRSASSRAMSPGSCTLQGAGGASASLASLASALLMVYQSSWCVFMCTRAVVH